MSFHSWYHVFLINTCMVFTYILRVAGCNTCPYLYIQAKNKNCPLIHNHCHTGISIYNLSSFSAMMKMLDIGQSFSHYKTMNCLTSWSTEEEEEAVSKIDLLSHGGWMWDKLSFWYWVPYIKNKDKNCPVYVTTAKRMSVSTNPPSLVK